MYFKREQDFVIDNGMYCFGDHRFYHIDQASTRRTDVTNTRADIYTCFMVNHVLEIPELTKDREYLRARTATSFRWKGK